MKTKFILFLFVATCAVKAISQNPVNLSYEGEKDGNVIRWYSDSKKESECTLIKGLIQGPRYTYYKSGKLMVKEQFKNGRFFGTNFMLNQDGDTSWVQIFNYDTLIYSKNFEYEHGRLYSTSSVWYGPDSGSTSVVDRIRYVVLNSDNLLPNLQAMEQSYNNHGIYREYYKNGQLKMIGKTKKVFLTGKVTEYYENGIKKKDAYYLDGKLNGSYIEFFDNANVKIKATYKDDQLNGNYSEFDQHGNETKSHYTNGELDK